MADVVLKDKNGNPVTHEGATAIRVPTASGGKQIFEPPYEMRQAYFYFGRPSGDGWEITFRGKGLGFGTTGIAGGFGMTDCQNYGYQNSSGEWSVMVLVSKNANLQVGSVYTTSEILNG